MKKIVVILFSLLLISNSNVIYSSSDNLELFRERTIQDVKDSFSKDLAPLNGKNHVFVYNQMDLIKASIALGKNDSHLESLLSLFEGKTKGERRLYIVGGQPQTKKYKNSFVGFLLYKKIDGTNVLIELRYGEKKWEIVKRKEIKDD